MKHIIILLSFLPCLLTGQRDTIDAASLQTFTGTISSDGHNRYVAITTKVDDKYFTLRDTFDNRDIATLTYIDSLITVVRQDSINSTINLEAYFAEYKRRNTLLKSAINYLTKLYAIRQDYD